MLLLTSIKRVARRNCAQLPVIVSRDPLQIHKNYYKGLFTDKQVDKTKLICIKRKLTANWVGLYTEQNIFGLLHIITKQSSMMTLDETNSTPVN